MDTSQVPGAGRPPWAHPLPDGTDGCGTRQRTSGRTRDSRDGQPDAPARTRDSIPAGRTGRTRAPGSGQRPGQPGKQRARDSVPDGTRTLDSVPKQRPGTRDSGTDTRARMRYQTAAGRATGGNGRGSIHLKRDIARTPGKQRTDADGKPFGPVRSRSVPDARSTVAQGYLYIDKKYWTIFGIPSRYA